MFFFKISLTSLFLLITYFSFGEWKMKDFDRLKKLDGNWEMRTEDGFIQEKWSRLNDSSFAGVSYKIVKGVAIMEERTQILFRSGEILFVATVSHQNKGLPVTFKLISIKDGLYIFENKDHDFPQQVAYKILNANTLYAFINGNTDKGLKTIKFSYNRIKK